MVIPIYTAQIMVHMFIGRFSLFLSYFTPDVHSSGLPLSMFLHTFVSLPLCYLKLMSRYSPSKTTISESQLIGLICYSWKLQLNYCRKARPHTRGADSETG